MKNVQWSRPDFGKDEKEAAKTIIDSGWLTQGKETVKFEEDLEAYLGCKHAIVISNGTSALITALLAHGIGQNDEVIVPTFTFIASINAIIAVGATPVLVDSDEKTFNTTPELMEPLITSKTKAIMPVDVAGLSIEMDAFKIFAKKHGLIIIEDAAEAIGSEYKGKKVGSFKHTTIFSFHMAKLITSIEGGCIITDDDGIADKCRLIRSHGEREKYGFETFGLNFRMTDLQAAIGRVQIAKINQYITHRNSLVGIYKEILGKLVEYQSIPSYATTHPHMLFSILVDSTQRDELVKHLNEKGIGTRIWVPSHLQEYHKRLFSGSYPVAETLGKKIIHLPIGNAVTGEEVRFVAETVKKWLENSTI